MASEPQRPASLTDPSTWCDHATAVAAWQAGHADGIAYVMTEADPFAAIELVHCRHRSTRSIDIWAQNFLDVARDTYAEVTPSGDGCLILGLTDDGTDPVHQKYTVEIDGKQVVAELCRRTPKVLTVTGYRLDTVEELTSLDRAFDWAVVWGKRRTAAAQANGHGEPEPEPPPSDAHEDHDLQPGAERDTSKQNILDAALDYAQRGWPVFPCRATNKAPLTKHGFKDATTDEATIRNWWGQWPDAMIGVPMGSRSGVWAVDPDPPKKPEEPDGRAVWAALVEKHGEPPKTHTEVTPRGGWHVVFKWDPARPVTNSPGALAGQNVDVRGEGGYIIVAPSVCIGDGTPKNVAGEYRAELEGYWLFATAPDWLYELILGKPEPAPQPKRDSKSFWRNVNDLALQNLDAWVPVVFGPLASYQPGTGAWRVSSEALGRNLEEDLSLHPDGIKDWGVHDMGDPKRGGRTAIDIVVTYGEPKRDAATAALWLCEQMQVDPVSLGWKAGAVIIREAEDFDGGVVTQDSIAQSLRPPLRGPTALLPPHRQMVRMDRRALAEGGDRTGVPVLPRALARVHRRLPGEGAEGGAQHQLCGRRGEVRAIRPPDGRYIGNVGPRPVPARHAGRHRRSAHGRAARAGSREMESPRSPRSRRPRPPIARAGVGFSLRLLATKNPS